MTTYTGSVTVAASRADTWAALADPVRLTASLSEVDDVAQAPDGSVSARLRPDTRLGLAPLTVVLRLVEQREPEWVLLRGYGTGPEYGVEVTAELWLAGTASGTEVSWRADIGFGGPVASVGQRVLVPLVTAELNRLAGRLAAVVGP